jgi:hypothetical protein
MKLAAAVAETLFHKPKKVTVPHEAVAVANVNACALAIVLGSAVVAAAQNVELLVLS